MRFRNIFILGGSLAVLAGLFVTDPDKGASTGIWLITLASAVLAVAFAHLARKGLFDYPEADMGELARKAKESPIGAAIIFASICLVIYGLLGLFGRAAQAQDVRTFIPVAAWQQLPSLKREQVDHWPDHPDPPVLAALIEHESCISLTHSRCWNPGSRLKTAREEGAGLGQITRAWRADGSLRFDTLAELRAKHPALRDWSWSNVYARPDLQLRAVVLLNRDNYLQVARVVAAPGARLDFADAAYNGGMSGVMNERRACALAAGCDPQQWFGHVEHHCLKSRQALYGQRSACDINRHHVRDVRLVRQPKYRGLL